jgi:hypothetical protein
LRPWQWEAAAILIFSAAFCAIFITLLAYDGRPLPQLPLLISINSLLSVYATIMKGALVLVVGSCISQLKWSWLSTERPLIDIVRFEDAVLGPWGSLQWLWNYHVQQPLTTFAALVTVLFISIDPFVQQLVRLSDCSIVVGRSTSSLPRTNLFDQQGFHIAARSSSLLPEVQLSISSAVMSGLLAPNGLNLSPQYECSTGNCTYPGIYHTFGYCSACRDVSESLQIVTTCYNSESVRVIDTPSSPTELPSSSVCASQETNSSWQYNITTRIPKGISLNYSSSTYQPSLFRMAVTGADSDDGASGSMPYQVQIIRAKTSFNKEKENPFTLKPVEGCSDPATNSTWACRGYGAAKCTFQPCVRTYNATVDAGVLKETLLDSSDPLIDWGLGLSSEYRSGSGSLMRALLDVNCTTAEERQRLRDDGYKIDESVRWLPYNITFNVTQATTPDVPFPQSMLEHRCLYLVNNEFARSLWEFLSDKDSIFTGIVGGFRFGSIFTMAQGPLSLQTIYNFSHVDFQSIDRTFQNVADSLTAYSRQNGQVNHSVPVAGEVLHYATCLSVQWSWIALPASLILCTLIIFITTFIVNAKLRLPVWKSSPLALLFHGPGGYAWHGFSRSLDTESVHCLASVEGMEDTARNITVILNSEGPSAQLVKKGF